MLLTPQLVQQTSEAVLQAYGDLADQPIQPPPGYVYIDRFYGWEGLDPKAPTIMEKFGLIFQSAQDSGKYLIAFRGTKTVQEWIDNVAFVATEFPDQPQIKVEEGFLDIYSKALANSQTMREALQKFMARAKPSELLVTGHSLGSALASLFAFDVATSLKTPLTLVTYASPNVGTAKWADAFSLAVPNCARIYNNEDIVPFVPPAGLGFIPVGESRPLEFEPKFWLFRWDLKSLVTNHSMDNYQQVMLKAIINQPIEWTGTFADTSQETDWTMASWPAPSGQPRGAARATLIFKLWEGKKILGRGPWYNSSRYRGPMGKKAQGSPPVAPPPV
ncbi:MAG: lipase family protein [Tepidisphaeraceae bacterium]|jgi:hypothetical protein